MLFAGLRSFRMVKNCDGGLENAALGHSFSPYEPNLSRQITGLFFFPRSKLVLQIINGFLCGSLRNFVFERLARRLLTVKIFANAWLRCITARETQDYAPSYKQPGNLPNSKGVYKTWTRPWTMAYPLAYPMAHPKFCNFTNYKEKNNYLRVQGSSAENPSRTPWRRVCWKKWRLSLGFSALDPCTRK